MSGQQDTELKLYNSRSFQKAIRLLEIVSERGSAGSFSYLREALMMLDVEEGQLRFPH